MSELPLKQAIPRQKQNESRFNDFVNGGTTTDMVTSGGVSIPSLAKTSQSLLNAFPFKGYATEAELLAALGNEENTLAFALDTQKTYAKTGLPGAGSWATSSAPLAINAPNILFDTFNEYSANDLSFGGFDWYGAGTRPTFTTASTHIPVTTPVVQVTGNTSFDKYWDHSLLNLKAGDAVMFGILAWFANAGGSVTAFWQDASNAFLGSNVKINLQAGFQFIPLPSTVPAGAVVKLRLRVQQTGGGDWEVGGYFAALGSQRPSLVASPLPKPYLESLGFARNLLWDPFQERLVDRPREGGNLTSATTLTAAYAGTLVVGSANSPWGKNAIQNTGNTGADRYFADLLSRTGVRAQDVVTLRALANFGGTGGSVQFIFRDASNNNIAPIYTVSAPGAGTQDLSTIAVVPTGAVWLTVRAAGSSMTKELLASAMAAGRQKPAFGYSPAPDRQSRKQQSQKNLFPDPFFRRFAGGITSIDGFGPAMTAGVFVPPYVTDYAASPFQSKKALYLPPNARTTDTVDMNVKAKRLGLKLNSVVTVKLGIVASQNVLLAFFGRTVASSVLGSATNVTYVWPSGTNVYQEISKTITVDQAMLDSADYFQVRLMANTAVGANGIYVVARGIFVDDADPILFDENFAEDEAALNNRSPDFGASTLRESRWRLMQLELLQSTVLTIAYIGDSWSHLADRWTGPFSKLMQAAYGSAGLGWVGFGYPDDANFGLINGNVLGGITFTKTGTWTPAYGTANSPDTCSVSSSDTSGTFRVNGFPAAVSALKLFLSTATGTAAYSFDGGSTWTNFDMSTGSNGLTTVDLAGIPAGAFNLWIKPVSGTLTAYGVDAQKASSGVRCHKIAATGTSAAQWATITATATWKAGLTALNPRLVTVMLATNDQTGSTQALTFKNYIRTIVTNIRAACPYADILILMPAENGRANNVPMAAYSFVAREVAVEMGVAFHDLQLDFGVSFADYAAGSGRPLFATDLIHPNVATNGGYPIVHAARRMLLHAGG